MKLVQVPFCDGTAFALRADVDRARILQELRERFGVRLPSPRELSELRARQRYRRDEHAEALRSGRYLASLRVAGGVPYLAYFTRADAAGACVLIEKRTHEGFGTPRMLLVRPGVVRDRAVCDGTLLDGELVRVRGECSSSCCWVFLASDVLACRGRSTASLDLLDRLVALAQVLSPESVVQRPGTDPLLFRSKPYFAVHQLKEVVERSILCPSFPCPTLDYPVSGILFSPKEAVTASSSPLSRGFVGERDVAFLWNSSARRAGTQPPPPPTNTYSSVSAAAAAAAAAAASAAAAVYDDDWGGYEEDAQEDHQEDTQEEPQGPEEEPEEEPALRSLFYVRATQKPDVYELYERRRDVADGIPGTPVAGVPTMQASGRLRRAATSGEAVWFEWVPRFNRWVPADDEGVATAPAAPAVSVAVEGLQVTSGRTEPSRGCHDPCSLRSLRSLR